MCVCVCVTGNDLFRRANVPRSETFHCTHSSQLYCHCISTAVHCSVWANVWCRAYMIIDECKHAIYKARPEWFALLFNTYMSLRQEPFFFCYVSWLATLLSCIYIIIILYKKITFDIEHPFILHITYYCWYPDYILSPVHFFIVLYCAHHWSSPYILLLYI